jgi:hypothetical protein
MEVLVAAETSDNIAMVQVCQPDQPRNRTRRHDDRRLTARVRQATRRLACRLGPPATTPRTWRLATVTR